jgi:UDP-N-acetylmuramyl tripeptide synthase
LPEIVATVSPRVIVFTNLFRDQLDRYGEVDTVARSWERALARTESREQRAESRGLASRAAEGREQSAEGGGTTIVLNADDPAVAHLGRAAGVRVVYFGVDDASAGGAGDDHASDFRTCLECGAELLYSVSFYGHIGHWRCDACGNARPVPDIRITRITQTGDSTSFTIATPDGELAVTLPLAGLYNAYNALAAASGAIVLGLAPDAIVSALGGFSAAFGRQERFSIEGRDVRVLLGKNPTGLNQVLRAVAASGVRKTILFFLNDGIADGRDVSWIWDADYELARPDTDAVVAAGTRADDLALRLKYAGFGDVPIEHETAAALKRALAATPAGGTLFVVPTYTAMLEVRELLAREGGGRRFWEAEAR